jgi:hypothetical protein
LNPCFFTAPSPLHLFAIVGVLGSRSGRLQLISSVFKLLPGRLPAGTGKSEFQRTVPLIAQANRGRNAHDAKFISIQACGYGWIILWRI